MAKLNIPPTKINLLNLKQSHAIAAEGYKLLEQKREIIVIELMSYLERVKRIEKELDKLVTAAYGSLKKAMCRHGREEIKSKTRFISYEYKMKKKSRKLIGMQMPSIETEVPDLKLQYSFLNTNTIVDETSARFLKLITTLCELAEIRTIVWRLSKELKKTQRRVNALEKIVIPETEETMKYIEATLEEHERDEMFIRKLVQRGLGNT